MPTIIFIEPGGKQREVSAEAGQSVMEAAVQNGVRGIDADCGGACTCATCHGYVDEAWRDRIAPAEAVEVDLLDFAYMRAEGSRLTCQLKVCDGMDGLLIRLPESQG
ncbi:2Fe-2S iron-sulfur cluster-binding protein [Paraburkholderia unamae]|uniref:2Fe-2S ferredoxin n=1 Tax=Paraburkholderia unamae TaxID=219649 RepID=A0ABX5KJ34_9BURK|nr:2Fe-2S iron-sulfur cluster-binding protein [Paraburkholderia unamae]PVX81639.1 2Fe-2S ferredoxin [Paraburkholderia unamae]RAR62647.1 2Fe-2S ferredoxin [Paraburkholderia unamae]